MALVLLGLAALPMATRAFSEPQGASYPSVYAGNEIPQFLNGSSAGQILTGPLLIGDTTGKVPGCPGTNCSKLCLNADPLKGTNDPTNCIDSWLDVGGSSTGSYLRKQDGAAVTTDNGYSRLVSDINNNQLVTLIAEPNTGSGKNAIRANGFSDANYAGQFAGTLYIANGTNTAKFCLNDLTATGAPGAGRCITTWTDVLTASPTLIRLQDMTSQTTHRPDQGNASTVGPFEVRSLVVGQLTTGLSFVLSCGDGICMRSSNPNTDENTSNCSNDCK